MTLFPRSRESLIAFFGPPLLLVALATPWLALAMPWDPDEARYLEIPREMAQKGDWIVPSLNEVPYLEKPPLYYWVIAGCFRLWGPNVLTARLVSLVSAMGVVLLTTSIGAGLGGRRLGARAGLVLATCPMFLLLSTIVTIDMFFSLWITAAIQAFTYGLRLPSQGRWRRATAILLAYFFLGLGFLTKGPVVLVVPGLLWLFWRPRGSSWVPPHLIAGTSIFVLVVLPWFLLVSKQFPSFLEFFFLRGNLNRFFGQDPDQLSVHQQPFHYYLPYLLGGAFPWSLYLLAPWKKWWADLKTSSDARFAWSWLVPGFLFFSLGVGKLPTYVLPLFPAVALLAAQRWADSANDASSARWRLGSTGAVCGTALSGVVFAFLYVYFYPEERSFDLVDRRLAAAIAVLVLFFPLSSLCLLARGNASWAFGSLIAMMLGVSFVGSLLKIPFDEERSMDEVAMKLREVKRPTDVLVCVNQYFPLLSFYLEGPVFIQGKRGELAYGSEALGARPDLFVDWERIRKWVSGPERLFITVHQSHRERTEKTLGTKLHLLEEKWNYLLLSDQEQPWPDVPGKQKSGEPKG